MQDPAFLGQLVLGHSPMINRERAVVATRLHVFPEHRDAPPDSERLLEALLAVWPAPQADDAISLTLRPIDGSAASPALPAPTVARPLSLNVASEAWLRGLLAMDLPPHVMIEVPAFMVGDPAIAARLQTLRAGGSVLIIKGRPVAELPREMLPCFTHSLIDVGEDRRGSGSTAPPGVARSITHIQLGVRTRADVDVAFERGAAAVVGWPFDDDPATKARRAVGSDLHVVMELLQRVDREEPVDRLEAVLKNDPQLAFRLMRYLNSAAFGLRVEITSFRHALMMLGYKKLKRWLALLLVSSNKDPSLKPVIHAAVRRGVIMEELARASTDEEMRAEMFICGAFSLLHLMLGQSLQELLATLPVSERVHQALVDGQGPYQPYLKLVQALESGVRSDVRESADAALLGLGEINAALLRALAAARELD